MPRLPDLSVLGQRPTPQSGRHISTADLSAPGRATAELGQVGQRIAEGEFQKDRLLENEAKREAKQKARELEHEAKQKARELEHERKVEADKQARRAERIATANAHADIQLGLNALSDELTAGLSGGTLDKDTVRKTWADKSGALVTESIGKMPEHLRELMTAEMRTFSGGLQNRLEDNIRKHDESTADAGLVSFREKMQRLAVTDMPRAIQQWEDVARGGGGQAGWDAKRIEKEIQGFREAVTYTAAYEALSGARNDRKALDVAEQQIGKMTDIDPQRRAALLDRVAGYKFSLDQKAELAAQRAQRQAEAGLKRAEAAFNTFQGLADKGTALDPKYIDQVIAQTAGTPYQAGVRAMAQQAAENGGLAAQPIAVQRATLDAINAKIAAEGRSPALDKRKAQIEGVLNGSLGDVEKIGGLRAAHERGVIADIAPLDTTNPQAMIAGLAKRVEQAEFAGRQWAGASVSPFLPEEAERLASDLSNMKPAEKSTLIATLAKSIPPRQLSALAKQIDGKDKGLALAMALGADKTTADRYTSELVIRGQAALKDKSIKADSAAVTGTKAQAAAYLGDAIQGKAREDVLEAASLIFYGMQSEGSADIGRAVRLAIGGDIIERGGKMIPIPAGIDADKFEGAAAAAASKAIGGKPVVVGGRSIPAAEFLAGLPSASLEPVGRGRYIVNSGAGVVTTDGRKPLILEVHGTP